MTAIQSNESHPAETIFRSHEAAFEGECADSLSRIQSALENLGQGWEVALRKEIELLSKIGMARMSFRNAFARPLTPDEGSNAVTRYQASSLFVRDCQRFLIGDQKKRERLIFVTGTEAPDGTIVLSRMLRVRMEKQSAAFVKANDDASQQLLIDLEENHGHRLQAMFHSHMSHGPLSTKPSKTDYENQDRFLQIGSEAIGGIFSLDGYVRFFSTGEPFLIEVYGTDVEKISDKPREKVFKLLKQGEEPKP